MRSVLSGVLSLMFEIVVCMSAFPDVRNFGIYTSRERHIMCVKQDQTARLLIFKLIQNSLQLLCNKEIKQPTQYAPDCFLKLEAPHLVS